MDNELLFNEKITLFNIKAKDNVDIINQLGKALADNNFIDATYIDSVIQREQNFPTGLVLANAGIAIPHASPENNVLKNGIAVATLSNPVDFCCMEDPSKTVKVNMVFMLALSSNKHLDILKKLFITFQDEQLVENLKNSTNKDKFLALIINNLK